MSFFVAQDVIRFLEAYQYQALFLLLLIEECGIPLPIPGDGMMMFAGYRVSTGHLSFVSAFAAMEAATLIGASFLWCLGRWGGRPLIHRYGRYLHITQDRLELAERWFIRHGRLSIVVGRLVPGLRIATSFVSGVFEVPYLVYLPHMLIGSSLYVLFFMALGLGLGTQAQAIVHFLWPRPMTFAVAGVAFLAIGGLAVWLQRRRRLALG